MYAVPWPYPDDIARPARMRPGGAWLSGIEIRRGSAQNRRSYLGKWRDELASRTPQISRGYRRIEDDIHPEPSGLGSQFRLAIRQQNNWETRVVFANFV